MHWNQLLYVAMCSKALAGFVMFTLPCFLHDRFVPF